MTDPAVVQVRAVGPILQVTLDRPHKRNAVDPAMTSGLEAAFTRLESDPALRVCVLAATGDYFCAGSDLVLGAGPHTAEGGQYGMIRRSRSKPLVAAVDGPALGGGFEMVLAADLVVASRTAWFTLPEGARGRLPAAGGLLRAPARLPRNVAVEMMLTGTRLEAVRAHELGLVNRLAEPGEVLRAAYELALATTASAPESVAQILRGLERTEEPAEKLGWAVTSDAMAVLLGSAGRTEGTAAFVERRTPAWAIGAEERSAILDATDDPHTPAER
ncbi:enoyl-CoA hydratase-related protein [Nocardioides sp. NPDC101246]|uniref:enoyl-CoA hydratase-related protein n=1 Tax=Nocardioides sp. NPDC101246 TaxID=3364336 RepID=UPI00381F1159